MKTHKYKFAKELSDAKSEIIQKQHSEIRTLQGKVRNLSVALDIIVVLSVLAIAAIVMRIFA
jgi:hypothetical protein